MNRRFLPAVLCLAMLGVVNLFEMKVHAEEKAEQWVSLFNGKDLEGWTPKITGHEYGENFANTFRVEDGVLKVSYDGYDKFSGQFGHLFYKEKFANYRLRVEYRFVGEALILLDTVAHIVVDYIPDVLPGA